MTKNAYGDRTLAVLGALENAGVSRAALIMRHSAREYVAGRHDLANPLTDAGRAYARHFGQRLGQGWALRAYSSPAGRCVETAELICQGQNASPLGRVRPVEALGVFYALDQQRMFKAMTEISMNLPSFVEAWQAGAMAEDIMMNAEQAAITLLRLLWARLRARSEIDGRALLDLHVSHDLTLYLLRTVAGALAPSEDAPVRYLDGLVLFEAEGQAFLTTHDLPPRPLPWLTQETF